MSVLSVTLPTSAGVGILLGLTFALPAQADCRRFQVALAAAVFAASGAFVRIRVRIERAGVILTQQMRMGQAPVDFPLGDFVPGLLPPMR